MKRIYILSLLLLCCSVVLALPADAVKFGHAVYVNLALGESTSYKGKTITLLKIENHRSLVKIEDEQLWLEIAKRTLPVSLGGLRIFVSDQINVKKLTTDPEKHNLLKKDVLLCLSDPAKPLLDPQKFTFPIGSRDGYEWKMEENSHMFAYLGLSKWIGPEYYRSHEGIDMDMHEARGKELHPLVAIESATVVLVADSSVTKSYDGCIILKSDSQNNIYYVYKHTNPKTHKVKVGQKVKKGEVLSYIWGDNVWGHLHFAIVHRKDTPGYADRYTNLLNFFPQLYELYHGDLVPVQAVRTEGNFLFGKRKQDYRNFKRLDDYNKLTGYGWKLGDWCTAQKVEDVEADWGTNARLPKRLHTGTLAECQNPDNYYDFEVAVENGRYLVNATVGDAFLPSSQEVYFEGTEAGLYQLQKGVYEKTKDHEVQVNDNKLTIRLALPDNTQTAGIQQLIFRRID